MEREEGEREKERKKERKKERRGVCGLTSKSWYCSSDRDFLATTRVLRPSLAMFPH